MELEDNILKVRNSIAVLNKDEEVFAEFKAATKARIMTYGIKNESEIMAKNIELYIDHSEFDLSLKGNLYHIVCPTIADFNIYNVLATVGVLVGLGFDDRMIIEAISDLKPVNGRMELIPNKHKITIIVDYCCHTKDFENVFKFADRVSRGNIIAVLGAPSKRHMARRKKIGALANRYLDHVILTELDDRGENIEEICKEIQSEITDIPSIIIPNRAVAVEQAIEQASPGDVVLLLGKGHEKFIALEVGQREYEKLLKEYTKEKKKMNYNKMIDHTVLKADTPLETIKRICDEAMEYGFASVCINPCHVAYCADYLKDSDVNVCTVIGFPLGANTSAVKAFETKDAIANGADEIDMVMNIGALKDKNYDLVRDDVKAVVEAANGTLVKVILETCLLTEDEIKKACELCVEAKADYVKTSTGFSTRGATIEDVRIMKEAVHGKAKVKAAGGVRTPEDMVKIVAAGADRIGTSAGCSLVKK